MLGFIIQQTTSCQYLYYLFDVGMKVGLKHDLIWFFWCFNNIIIFSVLCLIKIWIKSN